MRVGVAVIGCAGFMSQAVYLPQLSRLPGVEILGVSDARSDLGEQVAAAYRVSTFHAYVDDLLGDADVAAVFVLTPPWTHAELVDRCLLAGKAVFVEKPMALTSDDATRLMRLARSRQGTLWVGYMKHHDPMCRAARQLSARLASPLGRCLSVVMEVSLGRWRRFAPGSLTQGPLLPPPEDLGLPSWIAPEDRSLYFNLVSGFSHDVNLLQELVGEPGSIETVRLCADSPRSAAISCVLGYRDFDAALLLRVTDPGAPWQERIAIAFERGQIELEVGAPLLAGATSSLKLRLKHHVQHWSWPSQDAFATQVAAFVEQARTRSPSWELAERAVRDLDLTEAIYRHWSQRRRTSAGSAVAAAGGAAEARSTGAGL